MTEKSERQRNEKKDEICEMREKGLRDLCERVFVEK